MSTLFSFLFSRQMLAIVAVLVAGAALWFVGPLLAFGGVRPLESVGMRVTVIVLLLLFLLFLLQSWRVSAIGVAAACLLIWHAGPFLAIGAVQPLAPTWVRASVIGLVLLGYALYGLYLLRQALSDNRHFLDPFLRKEQDRQDLAREELKAVHGIVQRALIRLKAMRPAASGVRRLLEGKRYLYETPWYMVIGIPGAGKTTALVNSGLSFLFSSQTSTPPDTQALAGQGGTAHCDWWFAREAVLIDTAGRYANHEMGPRDRAEWRGFLGLLRKHRTRAPINGAIVMLNMRDLLEQDEAARLAHAGQLRERLLELRSVLGIRFPVYVMVTKMDLLEGFAEYLKALTSEGRAQVWGFTLPYAAAGQAARDGENAGATLESRLRTELQALTERLENGLAVRLQEEFDKDLRGPLFELPQEFASLTQALVQVVDAAFHDSRYDNTELNNSLRGVYFTSAAQTDVRLPANPLSLLQRLRLAPVAKTSPAAPDQAALAASADGVEAEQEIAQASQAVAGSHRTKLLRTMPGGNRSYFLSDLFTKVIIPEAHLVRPNLRWEFRFRMLRLIGHALALVMFLWLGAALMLSAGKNRDYLRVVAEQSATLKHRVSSLFGASQSDQMAALPDTLTAAQELPLVRGLNLRDPSGSFRYGLYSAAPVVDAAHGSYSHLQDSLLLRPVILRMETVLGAAIRNGDSRTAYETLRVYLQLHDRTRYNAGDVKMWVRNDWASSGNATMFGGRASMVNHVEQLFSGSRVVQSPFLQNAALIRDARNFLDANPSAQRLYERAKAAMQLEAPQEFALTRAVGPQAGTVFIRASGRPLELGVPGLFTYDGYHNLFSKRLPEFASKARMDDAWVMAHGQDRPSGPAQKTASALTNPFAASALEDDALTQDIRRQYLEEYAQQWSAFLDDIRAVTGTSLTFDLTVLRALAAPDSPLSRLARAAARETTLSRVLVSKHEDDKNFLERATDKLNQKSRDVLGISPQARQEKELVDNRFAALRELVTGEADAGLAPAGADTRPGLENVSGLLNGYYTLLVVADTALGTHSLPPDGTEAGMKLKLEGARLPAPFKAILTALADSGTHKIAEGAAAILRAQAEQQLNRINSMLAYQVSDLCRRGIEGRYPFADSAQEVSIDDFTRVFAAGGAADDFFQKQLAPFVDMSKRPWKYKNPASAVTSADTLAAGMEPAGAASGARMDATARGPTLQGELLKLLAKQGPDPDAFARMQAIQEAFFTEPGRKQMAWKVDMKIAEIAPSINELIMNIDGQVQRYAHGPVQALAVDWPGPRGGATAELTATPRIRPETSSINTRGAWALFRLLDRGKLIGTGANGRQSAEFQFDGRKVVLDFNSGSLPHPLLSDLVKGFSCPGSGA